MTYQKFKDDLISDLKPSFPEGTDFSLNKVIKNNDLILEGLTIRSPGESICPTVYLDPFYTELKEGKSYENILIEVRGLYNRKVFTEDEDLSCLEDFNLISDRIVFKLVNLNTNKKMLKGLSYIPYLDLAIIFCFLMKTDKREMASIKISDEMALAWGVDTKTLMEHAMKNTPALLPHSYKHISEMIHDFLGAYAPDEMDDINMYCLTNERQTNGAACMIYKDLLDDIAKKADSDLIILPSSTDEVLIVYEKDFCKGKNRDIEYMGLNEIIETVNSTAVSPECVLSDHPYRYSRKDKRIWY